MITYEVKDHAPSLLPDGKRFRLVWQDEFDGTVLDESKWDYRLSMMGKVHPAWTDRGVHLDGEGNCVFTVIEEDGRPVSSQLQTGYNFMDAPVESTKFEEDHLQWNIGKLRKNKFTHTHGYYECRCKLQSRGGWWSAFWLQSPIIGASLDPAYTGSEVDIMECFTPGKLAGHNVFTGGYGLDMQRDQIGGMEGMDDGEYHTFGLLWDESGYTFYVDGKADGKIEKNISHCPQFILISTEVDGYRHASHAPTEAAYHAIGDTFLVDYVRVFDVIE